MDAFEREYQADHSWEQLTEDEQGRLLPVVCWMARARHTVASTCSDDFDAVFLVVMSVI